MKCQDIYNMALALINENVNNSDVSDLTERAPLIIWATCVELADLNFRYCSQFEGFDRIRGTIPRITDLNDVFPLHDRFVTAAAYSLGKLLINDENSALANNLNTLYAAQISQIKAETPAEIGNIKNVY